MLMLARRGKLQEACETIAFKNMNFEWSGPHCDCHTRHVYKLDES